MPHFPRPWDGNLELLGQCQVQSQQTGNRNMVADIHSRILSDTRLQQGVETSSISVEFPSATTFLIWDYARASILGVLLLKHWTMHSRMPKWKVFQHSWAKDCNLQNPLRNFSWHLERNHESLYLDGEENPPRRREERNRDICTRVPSNFPAIRKLRIPYIVFAGILNELCRACSSLTKT